MVRILKIKFLSCFLTVAILSVFCFGFTASSIDLDGILSETDWRDAEPEVIVSLSGESNCDAYFATVSLLTEESSNRLFFGFKVKVPEISEGSVNYGVAVRINSDEFVTITPDTVSQYDNDKYSFEGVVLATSQTDFTAEVAVGVKYGLFTVQNIEVRVIDSDGEPSNVYALNVDKIVSEPETTTTYVFEQIVVPDDTTAKKTATTKQTTAKITTTKITTTKKTTTKKETTKKTTAAVEEVYDFNPIEQTTKKPNKITRIQGEVHTFDERTDVIESAQTTSFPYWLETTRQIPEGVETTVLTVSQLKMQKGFSYAAVAALILLALGICVVINLKRDKENK